MSNVDKFTNDILGQSSTAKQIKDAKKYAEDFRHNEMGGALYDWLVGAKQGIEEIGRSAANMGANVPADYLDEMALEKPELSPQAQAAAHRYDVAVQNFKNETVQPVALGAAMMGSSLGLAASVPFLINSTLEDAEANGVTQATKNLAYNLSPGTGFYDALLSGDADAKAYREAHPIRAMFMGIMGDADILAPAIHAAKYARKNYLIQHDKKTVPEAEKIVNAEFLNTTPKKKETKDNVKVFENEILKDKKLSKASSDDSLDTFNIQKDVETSALINDIIQKGAEKADRQLAFWDDLADINGKVTPVAPSNIPNKRVSINDIWKQVHKFAKAFPGSMTDKRQNVGGYFEPKTQGIRTRSNQTFRILSHEIGHFLDEVLHLTDDGTATIGYSDFSVTDSKVEGWLDLIEGAKKKWNNNEYSEAELLGEGLAEFVKEYTLNPDEAHKNFRNFASDFESSLTQHPELKKEFDIYCNMVRQWYNQSAEMRARGGIAINGDTKTPFSEKVNKAMDFLENTFVDDTAGLRRIIKDFEEITGNRVKFEDNPAEIALALKSYVPARTQMLLGLSKLSTEYTFHALKKVWKGVHLQNVSMADVYAPLEKLAHNKKHSDYLENNHYKDWHEAFSTYATSLHTLEVIEVMNNRRIKEIESKLQELQERKKTILQKRQGIGNDKALNALDKTITKLQQSKFLIEIGKDDYITTINRRDAEKVIKNAPEEFKEVSTLLSTYTENLLEIGKYFGFIDKETVQTFKTNYPNYVPLQRDFSLEKGVDTKAGSSGKPSSYVDIDSFFKSLSKKGSDRTIKDPLVALHQATIRLVSDGERNRVGQAMVKLSSKMEKGSELLIRADKHSSAKGVVDIWVDGKKQSWQASSPAIYEALKLLRPEDSSLAMRILEKVLSTPASILRTGATQTPFFTVWNILRDIPSSVLYTHTATKNGNIDVLKDSLTGFFKKSDAYTLADFEAQGVPFATLLKEDNDITTSLRNKTNPYPSLSTEAWGGIKKIYEGFTYYNEKVELYPRFQEFQRAMRQGYNAMEAGALARDITTNFSRAGTMGRKINKYIPFFNASVQGVSKFFRELYNYPTETISLGIMYVTLPSIFLWQQNHDKEWYKDLPLKEKNRNWHFEVNGVVYRLPKPELMGYFFGTTIERMLDVIADDDDRSNVLSETSGFLRDSLLPPLSPPIVLQLVEWQANYSFFRDRNIVNAHDMKYLEPEEQYNIYTSEVAKGIGSATVTSPMLVDNSIKGITASMGITALGFMDMLLKENETPTKHWTGLSRFTYNKENANTRSSDVFYAAHSKYAKKKDKKSRAIFKSLDSAKQQIDDIRSRINVIKNNPKLSGDRKSKEITTLEKQINTIQRHANSKILGYKYIQGNK